ncbi:hypothetical protein [Oceanivirga miroungae]|uniref:Outer membrane protein beta-barrel domain-containing protein n=1 Tax=Oceanivirga miroungae TaxID=1130046 RepID=A0A6I8MCA5_9FUSO|nr:hypothetical protein [Oceanivirga miroungae]VWL85856.1 hypothetical protein OMES3154_01142 [Oceanivirga miroungae]
MKKKLIIGTVVGFILASMNTFALDTVGPRHRLEGSVTIMGMRFDKKNQIKSFEGEKVDSNDNKVVHWNEYSAISVAYRPEWTVPVSNVFSVTMGPSINLGAQLNVDNYNSASGATGVYGLEGGAGVEMDLNFRIPNSEVIYIGIDGIVKGIAYLKSLKYDNSSEATTKVLSKGVESGVGLTLGTKVSNRIKIGARIGYENKQLWEGNISKELEGKKLRGQHIMPISVNFGYILGK